ncbi:hypothetical protein [Clostridium chromiireducens]|uniref:Uncharacterized protein n=1 Tax=Clostridium chromiireducens TaxID=225345 RepID=A0A1V4IC85_9CLOT|nr:hypothetical protein [Clostridium chromiireducens]OPJ57618.1 hypothetical protein CLCHR_43230 [Clostridium chromiireducens]
MGLTDKNIIDECLDKMDLLRDRDKKIRNFSLGMKQRLGIACANVPVKSIKIYVKLLLEGSRTIDQRINLIKEYKEKMIKDLESIQNGLNLIHSKLSFYEKIKSQNCIDLTYLDEWKMFKESE